MKLLETLIHLTYPHDITDIDEKRLISSRHINIIILDIFYLIFISYFRWITKDFDHHDYLWGLFVIGLEISAILVMCKSHHRRIHYIFWVRLVILGIFAHILVQRAFIGNLVTMILTPLQSLHFGGSMKNFYAMVAVQIMQTAYSMERNAYYELKTFGTEKFITFIIRYLIAQQFTIAFMLNKIFNNHEFYKKKSIKEETKRLSAENQKVFLLSFSHELRNLINNITGSVQICLMEEISSTINAQLKNAKLCGDVLLYLVNNILDHGKAEIGDLEINPKKVVLHEKLYEIWEVCKSLIEKRKLKASILISESVPKYMEVDIYRLSQIIFNLVSNSCKFTERGSITFSIKWIPGACYVTTDHFEPNPFDDDGIYDLRKNLDSTPKNSFNAKVSGRPRFESIDSYEPRTGILRIDIVDTGSGIPKERIPQLFTKFGQVSDDKSKRQIGTGLGLYIVKEICMKMQGDVRVYSKLGQGTAFVICLPLRKVPSIIRQNLKNVVIVSEDLINLNRIETCVSKQNSKIIGTFSSIEELKTSLSEEKWRERKIDIFIYDRSKKEVKEKTTSGELRNLFLGARNIMICEDRHVKNEAGFDYIVNNSLDFELHNYF